ncbi:MAG: hypothetical protein AAGD05_00925 [Bacteroidota bacterium]
MQTIETFIQKMIDLVAQDRLPTVLEQMRQVTTHHYSSDHWILLSGQYAQLQQKSRIGIISNSEATREKNKIRHAILQLLGELKERRQDHPQLLQALSPKKQMQNPSNHNHMLGNGNINIQDVNDSQINIHLGKSPDEKD